MLTNLKQFKLDNNHKNMDPGHLSIQFKPKRGFSFHKMKEGGNNKNQRHQRSQSLNLNPKNQPDDLVDLKKLQISSIRYSISTLLLVKKLGLI